MSQVVQDNIISIKINPVHLAAANFAKTDNAWDAELRHVFGRDACNARYEKRGRGEPGSTLRMLHAAREVARQHWEVVTGLKA